MMSYIKRLKVYQIGFLPPVQLSEASEPTTYPNVKAKIKTELAILSLFLQEWSFNLDFEIKHFKNKFGVLEYYSKNSFQISHT